LLIIDIRLETSSDKEGIFDLHKLAFGQDNESKLVDILRETTTHLSMVAIFNSRIIGHILYSKINITSEDTSIASLALGPMAVHPEFQKKGNW